MIAHVRSRSAGRCVFRVARERDQPPARRCRRQSYAGRHQRLLATPRLGRRRRGSFAEIPAINPPGNRRRILRPPAATQTIADGRQQKCDRELIAVAARTPMPQAAAPFVQRFADKRRRPYRFVDSSTVGAARRSPFIC